MTGLVSSRLRRRIAAGAATVLVTGLVVGGASTAADATVRWSSSVRASDGTVYTVTNHLTSAAFGAPREWLLAWAGPAKAGAPDFLAVIDATQGSRSYGKVVNTVTVSPTTGNEPHHMQYVWHKGDRIFAGGILSDTTYVFDSSQLPALRLAGVNGPTDTPCGSLTDAFHVLSDGTAYASFMGGPDVSGPCTYTNGDVRVGNGMGGSPGEIVHMGRNGETLAEIAAASPEAEDAQQCEDVPALPKATCANPHGLAVREDLHRMITSDFAEARNFMTPQAPLEERLARQTVRIFDITNENNPSLLSVSTLKTGPRAAQEFDPFFDETRVVMEAAVTHRPEHKGAFVSTMAGGAIYYTPDITQPNPQWKEVFDDTAAYTKFHPDGSVTGGGDNSSWLMVSPDDRFLFHTVMGQSIPYGKPLDVTSGMIYVLDIQKLLASGRPACTIDQLNEVYHGGSERDCPELAGVMPIRDVTDGGPHWGTMDNFVADRHGVYRETDHINRVAIADYFVAGSFGGGGDHRICIANLDDRGRVSLDRRFRDEKTGRPCVSFNRASWPHGDYGDSQPHGVLFAVSDRALR